MDSHRFDQIASTFAQVQTRRSAFRLFGAAAVGALGVSILATDDTDARRKRGKGKGKGKGAAKEAAEEEQEEDEEVRQPPRKRRRTA